MQLSPIVVTHGQSNVNVFSNQLLMSQFKRHFDLHIPTAKLVLQHRATVGLIWISNEICYFNKLEDGEGTALSDSRGWFSRELQRFHKIHFNLKSH